MDGLIVRVRATVTTEFVVYSDQNKTEEVIREIATARLQRSGTIIEPGTLEIVDRRIPTV